MNFESIDIEAAAGARARVLFAAAAATDNVAVRSRLLNEAARLLNAVPGATGTASRLTADEDGSGAISVEPINPPSGETPPLVEPRRLYCVELTEAEHNRIVGVIAWQISHADEVLGEPCNEYIRATWTEDQKRLRKLRKTFGAGEWCAPSANLDA